MNSSSNKTFLSTCLVLILLAAGLYIAHLLDDAGAFSTIVNHNLLGTCQKMGDIAGPEDIVKLPGTESVIISSDARDGQWAESGDLFIYDLRTQKLTPQNIKLKDGGPFHPHGIDVLHDALPVHVFAVNHRSAEETTIEVFQVSALGVFENIRTIRDPHFINGNDLAVLSADQFYLTTDFSSREGFKRKAEQYLRRPSGYVSFFDGQQAHVVVNNLFFANGIALTEDRKTLFAVETLGHKLHIFDVQPSTGEISLKRVLPLDFAADNITLDGSDVLFAVHPKILKLKAASLNHAVHSPSRVMQLTNLQDAVPAMNELLIDDGTLLSSSSVALRISVRRVLVGSVFDNHFLDCKIP
jgi:arylesterase/paraoxonase